MEKHTFRKVIKFLLERSVFIGLEEGTE